MRHILSAGHYEDEGDEHSDNDLENERLTVPASGGTWNGSHAWDIYYKDLADFAKIKQLMNTALPYCVRVNARSPLAPLALHQLQSEAQVVRPVSFQAEECNGFAGYAPGLLLRNLV